MTAPDLTAQIAEAKRELGMRYGVYRKKVAAGTMEQEHMNRFIDLQKAIVASLERLKRYDDALPAPPEGSPS